MRGHREVLLPKAILQFYNFLIMIGLDLLLKGKATVFETLPEGRVYGTLDLNFFMNNRFHQRAGSYISMLFSCYLPFCIPTRLYYL